MNHRMALFDVDATLLLTGGAGMRSMKQAGADVFGPALTWDGIEPSGGLDPILISEAASQSSIMLRPEDHDAFRLRYVALLEDELQRSAAGVRAMPGVHDVLAFLRFRSDVALGLLTGNYRESAALKLRAVGVDPGWFEITVYGDEANSRSELVALALRKYERRRGHAIDPSNVVIVGDTPRDVEAALTNGCRVLGVATGKYPPGELQAAGAHEVAPSLADPSKLWTLLGVE